MSEGVTRQSFSSSKRHFHVKLRLCHHFAVRCQVPVEAHDRSMWRVGGYCFTQAVAYRVKVDGLPGGWIKRPKLPHYISYIEIGTW
jgi:hypothetical protein